MFLNIRSILSYKKSFRNYPELLHKIGKRRYFFKVKLKHRERYLVWGRKQIYFTLGGSKRAIVIEPQRKSYARQIHNVKLNKLEDIIYSLIADGGSN